MALQFELVQVDAARASTTSRHVDRHRTVHPWCAHRDDQRPHRGDGPGAAELAIRAVSGSHRAAVSGAVDLVPFSAQVAELQACLADPDDTTVVAELVAGLLFRIQRNPVWALEFWRAVLGASP